MKQRSVFAQVGFSEAEASVLEMKSALLDQILAIVKRERYSQKQLMEILAVPQPRVSELLHGKLSTMSMEKLVTYLERLGCKATWKFNYGKVAG